VICIAYLSTAARPPDADELEAILAVSRRNNARQGVTGLLCHHDGSFLQFLEGDEASVEAVYARIAEDVRHHSLLRLYRRPISERLFPHWSIAIVRPEAMGAEHGRFCQGLREVEVGASEDHLQAIVPVLTSFRAWLR
jgi:hypothetical protein